MSTAVDLISQEIESHRARLAEIDGQMAELRGESASIERTIASLESVVEKLAESPTIAAPLRAVARTAPSRAASGKATDVVRQFLLAHPDGMRPREIADAIAGDIQTNSSEPRRLVMNTLLNLARQNQAVKGDDGRYRPTSGLAAAIEAL
jgi:hypothetical protein